MEQNGYCIDAGLDGAAATSVLHVTGELDLAGADRFCGDVCSWGERTTRAVDLDLRGLRFVDSCGMQALIVARDKLAERVQALHIVDVSAPVRRVFAVTGLAELFGIASD